MPTNGRWKVRKHFWRFNDNSLQTIFRVSNYGTVLYIELIQYTPDGRSVIKTRGERRFEIQKIRMHDGLYMANVEFIADKPIADGKSDHFNVFTFYYYCFLVELFKKMESEVYQLAKKWFAALSNAAKVCKAHFTSYRTQDMYIKPRPFSSQNL